MQPRYFTLFLSSAEVLSLLLLLWVNFGFTTWITVSPLITGVNNNVLLSYDFGFFCCLSLLELHKHNGDTRHHSQQSYPFVVGLDIV